MKFYLYELLLTGYRSSYGVTYVGDVTDIFSISVHAYVGSMHACRQLVLVKRTCAVLHSYIANVSNLLLLLCINQLVYIAKCKFILKGCFLFQKGFLQKPFQIRHCCVRSNCLHTQLHFVHTELHHYNNHFYNIQLQGTLINI